jgi:hypothetical protein
MFFTLFTKNKHMKLSIFIALLIISCNCFGQNHPFFGHLAKPIPASGAFRPNLSLNTTTPSPDSTFTGFRPTATAAYGYSSSGGSTLLAFAGIDYEHDTYTASSQTWYTNWAVSLQIGTGASNGSVSLSNATTLGLFGQFFNNLLTVGIGYNFSNKTALPLVGPGVAFH